MRKPAAADQQNEWKCGSALLASQPHTLSDVKLTAQYSPEPREYGLEGWAVCQVSDERMPRADAHERVDDSAQTYRVVRTLVARGPLI